MTAPFQVMGGPQGALLGLPRLPSLGVQLPLERLGIAGGKYHAAFDAVCGLALAGELGGVDASQDAGDVGLEHTQLLNGLRGHLTEVGVIAAQGPRHARKVAELIEAGDERIPFKVCEALAELFHQLHRLDEARLDRTIAKMAQKDETARRLMSIPGFGPITASAMAATIQGRSSFAGPRDICL